MFKSLKNTILVFFSIGVAIFSFSKAIFLFQDNAALNREINITLKPNLLKLENDNARISDELTKTQNSLINIEQESKAIKEGLYAKAKDLRRMQASLDEKERALGQINKKYSSLDSENDLLKEKINAMFLEYVDMKKTFSSVQALKEKIRDLKLSLKKNKKTERFVKKKKNIILSKGKNREYLEKKPEGAYAYKNIALAGNQGYLIKGGKNTYMQKERVRIEVLAVGE